MELLTDKETFARTVSQDELEEEDSMQVEDDGDNNKMMVVIFLTSRVLRTSSGTQGRWTVT